MDEKRSEEQEPRRRGLTSLTLKWLSDKLRHTESIKEKLDQGDYEVNSEKIASAILNKEQ